MKLPHCMYPTNTPIRTICKALVQFPKRTLKLNTAEKYDSWQNFPENRHTWNFLTNKLAYTVFIATPSGRYETVSLKHIQYYTPNETYTRTILSTMRGRSNLRNNKSVQFHYVHICGSLLWHSYHQSLPPVTTTPDCLPANQSENCKTLSVCRHICRQSTVVSVQLSTYGWLEIFSTHLHISIGVSHVVIRPPPPQLMNEGQREGGREVGREKEGGRERREGWLRAMFATRDSSVGLAAVPPSVGHCLIIAHSQSSGCRVLFWRTCEINMTSTYCSRTSCKGVGLMQNEKGN